MMTFQEWINTQDESKFELDQASIYGIKQYFMFREIVDDVKMPVFFWRTLAMYRGRYKALVRVESIEFDPLVNKYFEAEFSSTNRSTSNTTQTSQTDKNGNIGVNFSNEGTGNSSDTMTGTEMSTENVVDNKDYQTNTSKTGDNSKEYEYNIQNGGSDTVNGAKTETGHDSKTKTNNKTINSTVSGDTSENISGQDRLDRGGSTSVSGRSDTSGTSSRTEGVTGNVDTTADALAIAKNANKQAPMNAANITNPGGNSNGRLGQMDSHGNSYSLDFEYATAYNQADSESNSTGSEKSKKDTRENGSTSGRESHNETTTQNLHDTTQYGKSVDGTSNTQTDGRETDNGTENLSIARSDTHNDTTQYGKTEDKNGTETDRYGENSETTETGNGTKDTTGSVDTTNNKDSEYTKHETGNKDTVSEDHARGSYQNTSDRNADEINHNRYAGRDNLTPQKAMAEATDYLIGYSPAFQWLVDKLEPCFMAIYEL